ncbi:MAG: O-antigen ligase family protein, partial [Deltaproteobacteria bacterium]|nr:O-antigen ligase family protein [Deltaproteobacteria bacterium]
AALGVRAAAAAAAGRWGLWAFPWVSLPLLAVGVTFDDLYFSVGFALVGAGDVASFLFLGVWALGRLRRRRRLRLPEAWWLLALFFGLVLVGLALGPHPEGVLGVLARLLTQLVLVCALADEARDLRRIEQALVILIAGGVVHAFFAFYLDDSYARLKGIPGEANSLGSALGVALALGMAHFKYGAALGWRQWALAAGMAFMALALVFTISRGSYISVSVAGLWLFQRYWRRLAVVAGLLLGAFFVAQWVDADRFTFILRRLEFADESVENRLQVFLNALRLIEARPLFGIGYGQFAYISEVLPVESEAGRSPHNFYVGLTASTGVLAAGAFFLFVWVQLARLWREVARAAREELPAWRARAAGGTPWRVMMGEAMQAAMLFQATSLLFRGLKRSPDWVPLGLCCALYLCLADRRRADERARAQSGGDP